MSMVDNYIGSQQTPSICFNFDQSNRKSDFPYQYSNTTNKQCESFSLKRQNIQLVTPPAGTYKNLQNQFQIKTQEFFDEFDNNFIIKFDQSPEKSVNTGQFQKVSQYNQSNLQCKVHKSNISEPLSSNIENRDNVENQEQGQKDKTLQNISTLVKQSKHPFQIRKRVAFKNNQNLINKSNKQQYTNKIKTKKIINHKNLLIVTSNCWTGVPQTKKAKQSFGCKSTKCNYQKTLKKDSIFNNHQIFKQTLRSTTLDNWRKKYKKTSVDKRKTINGNSIFQKPFGLR